MKMPKHFIVDGYLRYLALMAAFEKRRSAYRTGDQLR